MKKFDNLFGSIYCTFMCIVLYAINTIYLIYGIIPEKDPRALTVLLIFFVFFLAGTLFLTYYVLFCSYQQWIIKDDKIILKKLIGKDVCINENEIQKIEKKRIFTIILGPVLAEAFIIHGKTGKISILLHGKRGKLLEDYFAKYESIIDDQTPQTPHPGCLG